MKNEIGRTRFLHTSDWQLGVKRHFLDEASQAQWSEARMDGVRNLGRIAQESGCEFIVVAGDIFESNQVDRRTVVRACEAMAGISVPIYLLPGNHDPLDAGSVFNSTAWKDRKPAHVHVFTTDVKTFDVRPGVEVVGAPWTSKRPLNDLVAATAQTLDPRPGLIRVMVGHGAVDHLSPDRDNPAVIRVAEAEGALAEGRYHYLALGDRHSFTAIGGTKKIYYSGTHEAYDFGEIDPGKVLVVDLTAESAEVTAHQIGSWKFLSQDADISTQEDVEALSRALGAIPHKQRTVLKLGLIGTLGIQAYARLEEVEAHSKELFAAVVRSNSRSELGIMPAEEDFDSLNLAGFGATAVKSLRTLSEGTGPNRDQAADALALLVRLLGRTA